MYVELTPGDWSGLILHAVADYARPPEKPRAICDATTPYPRAFE
jgi:hypothetical protein